MKRILAIDFGTIRMGLALTDELQMIASPLKTVARKEILNELEQLFKEFQIELVVIGDPLDLRGHDSNATKPLKKFLGEFASKFPSIPVVLQDERYTSKLATRTLLQSGVSKKKRRDKSLVDKIAAAIILQAYLEGRGSKPKF